MPHTRPVWMLCLVEIHMGQGQVLVPVTAHHIVKNNCLHPLICSASWSTAVQEEDFETVSPFGSTKSGQGLGSRLVVERKQNILEICRRQRIS